jgi:hypothetical protein
MLKRRAMSFIVPSSRRRRPRRNSRGPQSAPSGCGVSVTLVEGNFGVLRTSAAYAAREGDIAAQVAGHEIDAKIALAGPLAQMISRPNRNDRAAHAVESHEEDFACATNAAASIVLLLAGESLPESGERRITLSGAAADSYDATFKRLKREAEALLLEHWPAVKRVAKALFVRDRLDQMEVERLIAGIDRSDKVALRRQ